MHSARSANTGHVAGPMTHFPRKNSQVEMLTVGPVQVDGFFRPKQVIRFMAQVRRTPALFKGGLAKTSRTKLIW
jgi:hypothetical protein